MEKLIYTRNDLTKKLPWEIMHHEIGKHVNKKRTSGYTKKECSDNILARYNYGKKNKKTKSQIKSGNLVKDRRFTALFKLCDM
jgi:hypothetical protein